MTTFTDAQFESLGHAVGERTLQWLLAHLHEHFPGVAAASGEAAVRRFGNHCMQAAQALQLESQRAYLCLMSLKLYFGCGFADDPQCQGFAAILQREDVATPDARIERAWREGMAWHDRMAGEGGVHAQAAMQRLAGLGLARMAAEDAPLDAANANALLNGLWPQKHALLLAEQPEALDHLMRGVALQAREHGLQHRGQVRALLALAYGLGSGFAADPLLHALQPLALQPQPAREALAGADAFLARWAGPPPA